MFSAIASDGHRTSEGLAFNTESQRLHLEIEQTTRKLELGKRRIIKLKEDVARAEQQRAQKLAQNRQSESAKSKETLDKEGRDGNDGNAASFATSKIKAGKDTRGEASSSTATKGASSSTATSAKSPNKGGASSSTNKASSGTAATGWNGLDGSTWNGLDGSSGWNGLDGSSLTEDPVWQPPKEDSSSSTKDGNGFYATNFLTRNKDALRESLTAAERDGITSSTPLTHVENRLAKTQVKLNVLEHENRKIRQEVEEIRRGRLQCNAVCKNLSNQLAEKERVIKETDEKLEKVKSEQSRFLSQMKQLKLENEKEQKSFKLHVRNQQHLLTKISGAANSRMSEGRLNSLEEKMNPYYGTNGRQSSYNNGDANGRDGRATGPSVVVPRRKAFVKPGDKLPANVSGGEEANGGANTNGGPVPPKRNAFRKEQDPKLPINNNNNTATLQTNNNNTATSGTRNNVLAGGVPLPGSQIPGQVPGGIVIHPPITRRKTLTVDTNLDGDEKGPTLLEGTDTTTHARGPAAQDDGPSSPGKKKNPFFQINRTPHVAPSPLKSAKAGDGFNPAANAGGNDDSTGGVIPSSPMAMASLRSRGNAAFNAGNLTSTNMSQTSNQTALNTATNAGAKGRRKLLAAAAGADVTKGDGATGDKTRTTGDKMGDGEQPAGQPNSTSGKEANTKEVDKNGETPSTTSGDKNVANGESPANGENYTNSTNVDSSALVVSKKNTTIEDTKKDGEQFSEGIFMRRIFKTAFCNAIQRRHIKQHQKSISIFEQAFLTIRNTTGISDIDEIVKIFLKLEERNYSLLVFVNLLNQEIEKARKELEDFKQKRNLSEKNKAEEEQRKEEKLRELKEEIEYNKLRARECELEFKKEQATITAIEPVIEKIARSMEEQMVRIAMESNLNFNLNFTSSNVDSTGNSIGGPTTQGVPGGHSGNNTIPAMMLKNLRIKGESMRDYLSFIERTLTQWREHLPILTMVEKGVSSEKPFPYTVAQSVKSNLQPKSILSTQVMMPHSGNINFLLAEQAEELRDVMQESSNTIPAIEFPCSPTTSHLVPTNVVPTTSHHSQGGMAMSHGGTMPSGRLPSPSSYGLSPDSTATKVRSPGGGDIILGIDDDDDMERPWSQKEIMSKIQATLAGKKQKKLHKHSPTHHDSTGRDGSDVGGRDYRDTKDHYGHSDRGDLDEESLKVDDRSFSSKPTAEDNTNGKLLKDVTEKNKDKSDLKSDKTDEGKDVKTDGKSKRKSKSDDKKSSDDKNSSYDKKGDDMLTSSSSSSDFGGSSDDESVVSDDENISDEQISEIFLKRYKMSKSELTQMASKLGIALNNLCYLKQEFDLYDEDQSGFIDLSELRDLLEKLGEDLSEEELQQAFTELDQDSSGEIEFFEFVEWFASEE